MEDDNTANECPKCRVEPVNPHNEHGWCSRCETSHMMMEIVLDEYIQSDAKPDQVTQLMMSELDFLFKRNTTLFGYLNTAVEVSFNFLFAEENRIPRDDLREMNQSRLPNDEIADVLKQALLIEDDGMYFTPGPLTERMRDMRLARISIRDPDWQEAMTEAIGVMAVALTKSLFEIYGAQSGRGARFPRSAMSLLHLLAYLILEAERTGEPVNPRLALNDFFRVTTGMLTPRQRKYAIYLFISVVDGRARLLQEFDNSKQELVFADVVVNFLERTRELMREYKRARARG
ncbi:MAG: hypothetical protein ACE5KV_08325 [Thermoplasmata archaeon]